MFVFVCNNRKKVEYMAKKLISKSAIKFIVVLRNDETQCYSFSDISKLVAEKFGVEVSWQTIAYHYKRNKDIDTGSPSELSEVKPNSNITAILQQRKAEKQTQVATLQSIPAQETRSMQPAPSKRVYQAPDIDKLTRMLHMSDDEFKEMMRQEATEQANQKIGKLND